MPPEQSTESINTPSHAIAEREHSFCSLGQVEGPQGGGYVHLMMTDQRTKGGGRVFACALEHACNCMDVCHKGRFELKIRAQLSG
jgi:hypothetical protein